MNAQAPDLDIEYLQNLAYLDLSVEQKERLKSQVGRILGHVAELQNIDTQGIEPLFTTVESGTALRTDIVNASDYSAAILANGPKTDGPAFVVPRIL